MKPHLKLLFLLFVFAFVGCENEPTYLQVEKTELLETNVATSKTVTIDEIPQISKFLHEKIGDIIFSGANKGDGVPILDLNHIIQVVDTLNNANYTFSFSYEDTPDNISYNLVVGRDSLGNLQKPVVLKYITQEADWENFVSSGYDFTHYNADIQVLQYTDFFDEGIFGKDYLCETQFDQYGDPIPCETQPMDGGSLGGGGSITGPGISTGTTSGTGSTGGFPTTITVVHNTPDGGSYVFGSNSVCQHPGECTVIIYISGDGGGTKKELADCPDCSGTTSGLVATNLTTTTQKLKLMLSIPDDATTILYGLQANPELTSRIITNLKVDGFTAQAKNEAWMTIATELTETPWKSSTGTYLGRPSLAYKAVRTITEYGQNMSQFLLNNNDVITVGTYRNCSGCSDYSNKTFYYSRAESLWYEYNIPPVSDVAGDLNYLMETIIWESSVFVGRYVLPVEDVVILIDGKDFDGVEQSRVQAAGFLIVGIIPGGKVTKALKPVAKVVEGMEIWGAVAKAGNKTISFGLKKSGEAFRVLKNARSQAGKALGSGVEINGKWLRGTEGNAGFFPKSIADKMRNKTYSNFDQFRQEFWKHVANDPELASQFEPQNISKMKEGLAPSVRSSQQLGGQKSYILHHKTPINQGGAVYDVDNLYIVTPKYHKEILLPEYHYGYGY